jgi:hypothetical protein
MIPRFLLYSVQLIVFRFLKVTTWWITVLCLKSTVCKSTDPRWLNSCHRAISFITIMKVRLQKFLHPDAECHANLNLKDVCGNGRVSWKVGSTTLIPQLLQRQTETVKSKTTTMERMPHDLLHSFLSFFFVSSHPRGKQVCYFRIYFLWSKRVKKENSDINLILSYQFLPLFPWEFCRVELSVKF